MWGWILAACAVAFLTKFVGFSLPARLLEKPVVLAVTTMMTIGLLAALIATNTVSSGCNVVLDARLVAFAVAIILLSFDVPFLAVVVAGAVASALVRLVIPEYYEPQFSAVVALIAVGVVLARRSKRGQLSECE